MKKLSILMLVVVLSGCANFETRVACTVSGDKAYSVSEYMQLGISTQVSNKDLPKLCGVTK